MTLEEKAINAVLTARNEKSLAIERWKKYKLENAYKSLKVKFPELTKDDKHLILAGHKFEPEWNSTLIGSNDYYSMRSCNGYMPVYDLESFGEYLIRYNEKQKEPTKTTSVIGKIYNFIFGK